MRTTLEARVVIVGAGPVGLTLAGELGLRGVDVVVLERREVPSTESRASTLHARTMELLALRGLLDEFGELPHEPLGHFGGIPLDLNLPSPYAGQWKVPQTRTTAILRSWAIDLGAVVLEGHSLSKVTTTSSGIVVRVDSRHGSRNLLASYLVGCDGETSTTARLMNPEFAGRSSDRQLHRVDVTGIDIRNRKFERLTSGLAIAARREDVTRVMVHEFGSNPADGRSDSTFDDIARIWKRVTGEDIRSAKPQWVNSFGNASQQAKKYRSGRLFLAGDAAHRQMPVGGQALNLGMQDAFNLGWKLAMAVCGSGDERLLDSYHDERHAVGARVLAGIEAQASLLLGGPEIEPLRSIFTALLETESVQQQLAATISGLDIDYRRERSPGQSTVCGSRVHPDVVASDPRAADDLRQGRGAVIDFRPDCSPRWWQIIRPDGYEECEGIGSSPYSTFEEWHRFTQFDREPQRLETS